MKKLTMLSLALLFSVALVFGQVEQKEKQLIKETQKELKEGVGDAKAEKKAIKAEKKELRHLQGNDVSDIAKDHFYSDFGNASGVEWNRDGLYDIATFKKDGKVTKAYYDFDSHLVGTTNNVTFADLPKSAQKEIKKEYADYDIGPVVYFDNNDSDESAEDLVLLYGIQFESQDNYFVELTKGTKKVVVQVLDSGDVFFYEDLK